MARRTTKLMMETLISIMLATVSVLLSAHMVPLHGTSLLHTVQPCLVGDASTKSITTTPGCDEMSPLAAPLPIPSKQRYYPQGWSWHPSGTGGLWLRSLTSKGCTY